MILVDTGYLVALVEARDELHERGLTQALAHDHHFEQAGFDALLRREPS